MGYTYTGDAHRALQASLQADEEPFPTRRSLQFPRRDHLRDEVGLLERLFFPRCWNAGSLVDGTDELHETVRRFGRLCYRGLRPYADAEPSSVVDATLDSLPGIRETLRRDVEAAYKGDPAAKSHVEIIRSYPGIHALVIHRVAHVLYEHGGQEYARELAEYARFETGIDIHPGATLGEYCFIDHGTGVVIGETATVGDWARIYQNVTLGALHFEEEEDDEHALKKGYKRHPDVGDHVVIGAGSNVLGPITVGDHVSIGANSWVADDVPDHTSVFVAEHPEQVRKGTDD
jgi:serine O-acetyltransferase